MWYDVDISFDKAISGDIKHDLDNDAIQNSLTNIWKTLPGSRRMLYPFASPTWGMLFEQMDEETSLVLGDLLLQSIEKWEDRIEVDNLHVEPYPDRNEYVVNLTYRVISAGEKSYIYTEVIRPV